MSLENLIKNAFLDDLHDDWVAVAANGTPIARASTETAVRRAAPDAAHYLNAGMLAKHVDGIDSIVVAPTPSNKELITGEVGKETGFDAPDVEPNPIAAGLDAVVAQSAEPAPVADGSAFDGDGDGHVGGSKPRGRRAAAKK